MHPLTPLLTIDKVEEELSRLKGWRSDGSSLSREYRFASFVEAIGFVGKVATAAEAANHHPDIDIRYDKVLIRSWSHDAGGITQRDLDLAAAIDTIQTG